MKIHSIEKGFSEIALITYGILKLDPIFWREKKLIDNLTNEKDMEELNNKFNKVV